MSQYDDDFDRWCQYGDDDEFENTGTCKFCGARVDFIHSGVRWRVYEVGAQRLHRCTKPASPDEFADLDA